MGERMTRDSYECLAAELTQLEERGRAQITEMIRHARGFGDIAENAEYQAALDEQAHLEARIRQRRERLGRAVIVDEDMGPDGVARVASLVEIEDESGERMRLRVAAPDPEAEVAGLDSPLGRAVLGARAGDILEVRAPRRTWRARVIAVCG